VREYVLFVRYERRFIFEEEFAEAGAFVEVDTGKFEAEPLAPRVSHQHLRANRAQTGANLNRNQCSRPQMFFAGRDPSTQAEPADPLPVGILPPDAIAGMDCASRTRGYRRWRRYFAFGSGSRGARDMSFALYQRQWTDVPFSFKMMGCGIRRSRNCLTRRN
jgi:hypothetical protein